MTGDNTAGRNPMSVFHIGNLTVSGTAARAQQQLCAQFVDHRGRIDMPAYGVLFDDVGGIPFHLAGKESGALSMQARLTMSAMGYVAPDDRLTAAADVEMSDEHTGVTPVRITTGTGHLCCVGTARNMRVGRATADGTEESQAAVELPDCADTHGVRLPEPIPAALEGRDVVAQIAARVREAGPLADLLNGRIEIPDASAGLRFVVDTEPWMGNVFGTMHGGVIATIVGQAFSFAGQAHAGAGRDYHLADMSLGFFRSPAVHSTQVIVDVEPVKVGRRIASFSARMIGHDGTLLSEGVADVHYR
ncbi:PaaI family thioesterase [Gordonia sp. NPDC003504]